MSRRLAALVVLLVVAACTQTRDRAERERTVATPASGPAAEKVTVPDLQALTTSAADSTLRQTGLLLEVNPVGGGDDAVVISQRPEAGDLVPGGTVVRVKSPLSSSPLPVSG